MSFTFSLKRRKAPCMWKSQRRTEPLFIRETERKPRILRSISRKVVFALFYSIYFVKQLSQKHRGIQTMQVGRRKEAQIRTVETLMSVATVGIVPAQLLSIGFGWSHLPAGARFTGFCVGMIGNLIFLASVLCMKDSWRAGIPDRDKTALVTGGIYQYSRNPAFGSAHLAAEREQLRGDHLCEYQRRHGG